MPSARQSGQTTLELILSLTLIAVTLTGAGWLLHAQWTRAKCAYLVFEHTRSRLSGILAYRPGQSAKVSIRIHEDENEVQGSGICGEAREKVSLRKLEAIAP